MLSSFIPNEHELIVEFLYRLFHRFFHKQPSFAFMPVLPMIDTECMVDIHRLPDRGPDTKSWLTLFKALLSVNVFQPRAWSERVH